MIEEFKKELQSILEEFRNKLREIRSYKFTLHWLENVLINAYGKKYELKSLASISQLDITKYKVEPWDENILADIERDIKKTNFGGSVIREKRYLIVTFPPITEETKKELIKNLGQIKEEIRIKARKLRDDFLKELKDKKDRKEISEDIFYKTKEKADKEIEEFNKKVEELFKEKEKEIIG
ncbi:MAG: ribosome-recycling factor [Minisyncoccia bacterium]|jgi:ribosome recycling factor